MAISLLSGKVLFTDRGLPVPVHLANSNVIILLRFDDTDRIRNRGGGPSLAFRVVFQHDGNLNTENTLTKKNVADGLANVHGGRVTSLQHVSVNEFHALSTLPTDLTGNNNLTTLGGAVHDEAEDTVASTTDSQTHHQLVAERFSLGSGAESTVLDTLGEEVDGTLGEPESLLNDRGELTDADGLVTEDILGAGGVDDDLSGSGGNADLDTGVVIFSQLTSQKLVKLGVEDTIRNELPFLGDRVCVSGHAERWKE